MMCYGNIPLPNKEYIIMCGKPANKQKNGKSKLYLQKADLKINI